MNNKQWVQHISGQGEKWEVSGDSEVYERIGQWKVFETHVKGFNFHYLPKSEYRLCEAPERWVDVTEQCKPGRAYCHDQQREARRGSIHHCADLRQLDGIDIFHPGQVDGYRLRKVQIETPHKCGETLANTAWAFIVEKKVTL